MKFFALLLVLIATVFGQLPNSPALPAGAFTTQAEQERYTIPGVQVTDPNTQYLRIRIDSTAPGTFSASAGCLPEFEFLAASDSQFDSQCTLTAAGTCYLQLQPGIVQNMVDNYLLVEAGVGASVTVTATLETLTLQPLAETLDQPLNGNLMPGGMAVFGPLFVSAGGGYSATGAPNHIAVIMSSPNDFEVATSFEAPNTQDSINTCRTTSGSCFVNAADTCGIDVVASGNWFIVVRDASGLGGAFNGFLELRVLPTDPDFQVNFSPGGGSVATRGSNLNLIDRTTAGLNGAFELVFTLTNPSDSIEAHIADESTGTLIGAQPCSIASCVSDVNGECRLVVDTCVPGPFNVVVTAVNSATAATSVPFTSVLRSLVPTPAAFGTPVAVVAGETVLQVPAATPNGAIAVEATGTLLSITGNRGSAAADSSVCPDTATSNSGVSVNAIIPSCIGTMGDYFITVNSNAADTVSVTNETPAPITSGVAQTGTLTGTAADVFTLAYDGVPTTVTIADNANTVAISAQTTSSSVCQSSTDLPTVGDRIVPVCAPQGATASILVGAHAVAADQSYDFTATVNPAVNLAQGAPTTFDLTAQDVFVFNLNGASGTAAVYAEVAAFTQPISVALFLDCQVVSIQVCNTAPCRVSVTDAGFSAAGRYSVGIVNIVPNAVDNAATVTFQSGTNTCVAAGSGPCTGTTGSVSVAAASAAVLSTRASNDIAQFNLNGACDATAFVCGFQFPPCDGNGFVTLPTQNECQAQFDSCGFSCFNACDGLAVIADEESTSSAATLTVFTGLVAFLFALF
eukprot:TRINITY_DN1946_c0_g2_i2.p1 TRINITY_DN1946_c0_g2~~TRINITY_DN1946_c0_g2_i2.p1  ORF type:complete len:799 (-),score=124.16 TRINITY_DN1946_c0_g2_i2:16-2412(-)